MPRKSDPDPDPNPIEEEAAAIVASLESARPRRSTRRNVFYSDTDYDLGGIPIETTTRAPVYERPPIDYANDTELLDPDLEYQEYQVIRVPDPKHHLRPGPGIGVGPSNATKRKIAEKYGKRKAPKLDAVEPEVEQPEQHITRDEDMDVAMELEIPHNDGEGPPVLGGPSDAADADEASDDDDAPPDLEKNPLTKRRGRPKLPYPFKKKPPAPPRDDIIVPRPTPDAIKIRVNNHNHTLVRVFHDELFYTPEGVPYALVLNGCITELMRKERIIDMLVNADDYAQQFPDSKEEWFLPKPPRLPPLTPEKMCAVFYVDGHACKNAKDISFDDLRPWSVTRNSRTKGTNIKPNVRRHPVARLGGQFKIVKHETRLADMHLTEYSARLPREQRLRKKIFYLTRDNTIVGNVLIIYDYISEGNPPIPVSMPHGNDLLRTGAIDYNDLDDGIETDSPFENDTYAGMRGGNYLKLRAGKLGWAHNKQLMLDYMFNKHVLADEVRHLNRTLPDLPPLIEDIGVFVYFVPSENVVNQLHHAADGLSPWTTASLHADDDFSKPSRVRSTKRPLQREPDGSFTVLREPREHSDTNLIETMSTLARCKRIRKRLLYIQQKDSHILGNVCYIYEFLSNGPLPELSNPLHEKQLRAEARYSTARKKQEMEIDYPEDLMPNDEDDDVIDVLGDHHQEMVDVPVQYPDMLDNGFDPMFQDEDPIDKAENPEPYYDISRELSTRHIFLTVRHKKVVTSIDHVMEWIANTNQVEERGLLNGTKPAHPPMVTNARAYVFFVAGTAIFPHDINRDDFSPWSHNGTADNPTCYRTKVRKLGVVLDSNTSQFMVKDGADYKKCPFHLVFLYSINPKDPRLRKKIYYLMETESKMVVSHALILYDYNATGDIVKLNSAPYKPLPKKVLRSTMQFDHTDDPIEDRLILEENRQAPFDLTPLQAVDGTVYLDVTDPNFWNDRNRQLQYLVNEPDLVENIGCLNNKVPDLPPSCTTKGMFAFFVNCEEVNIRTLTVDKLVPWSESSNTNMNGISTRPKSGKTPLRMNIHGQLLISRLPHQSSEYQLHTYSATLPRCPRLRKKVVYVQRGGHQCGLALIMYNYRDPGEMPQPLEKLVFDTSPNHVVNQNQGYGYNMRNRAAHLDVGPPIYANEWTNADGTEPSSSSSKPVGEVVMEDDEMLLDDGEMVVEHTEIIEAAPFDPPRRNPFLGKDSTGAGYVRGNQRYEAMWRIAQKQFNDTHIDDTFDKLFRLLYEKSEARLLQAISQTFNVNIYAGDEQYLGMEEMIPEGEFVHPDEVELQNAVIPLNNDEPENQVVENEAEGLVVPQPEEPAAAAEEEVIEP